MKKVLITLAALILCAVSFNSATAQTPGTAIFGVESGALFDQGNTTTWTKGVFLGVQNVPFLGRPAAVTGMYYERNGEEHYVVKAYAETSANLLWGLRGTLLLGGWGDIDIGAGDAYFTAFGLRLDWPLGAWIVSVGGENAVRTGDSDMYLVKGSVRLGL